MGAKEGERKGFYSKENLYLKCEFEMPLFFPDESREVEPLEKHLRMVPLAPSSHVFRNHLTLECNDVQIMCNARKYSVNSPLSDMSSCAAHKVLSNLLSCCERVFTKTTMCFEFPVSDLFQEP